MSSRKKIKDIWQSKAACLEAGKEAKYCYLCNEYVYILTINLVAGYSFRGDILFVFGRAFSVDEVLQFGDASFFSFWLNRKPHSQLGPCAQCWGIFD